MVVQHNITAINANRYYGINNNKLAKSLEKLSSGYAINRAGDNAAGLAVSEKMRSQIAGINQGVKNAQDGISMIQTFEGALTETDSILQRMKVLADQSANGTYQNEVDRDAIQLEFNQLNDELNQIADTDFNGVVVLNGGQMADGVKAHNGKFDYATKKDDIIASAKEMFNAAKLDANNAIKAAKEAMSNQKFDLSANGDAPEWNGIDNNQYTKTEADVIWKAMKITEDGTATGDVDTTVTDLDVTFTFDGTSWTATKAVDNNGKSYTNSTDLTTAFATTDTTVAGATGEGGFKITNAKADVVFDATNAKKGDTITLKFTNGENTKLAPDNIAFDIDSVKIEDTGKTKLDQTKFTVKLGGLKDTDMTQDLKDDYDALNGLDVKIDYVKDTGASAGMAGVKITLGGKELNATTLGANVSASGKDGSGVTVNINGRDFLVAVDDADAPTKLFITDAKDTSKLLMEVDFQAATDADQADDTWTAGTEGSVAGKIIFDTAKYVDSSANIRIDPSKSQDLGTSKEYQDAISKAEAQLAELAKVDINSFESAKEYLQGNGVSVSDALDQATAPLTYTDHLMLQAGARTKDLVDFTFKYESQGLGDLEADLNCSARGLGTDKLSLATQEDANYAIDRIDNAINKTNMVRATFGAVQNRLEHKIDNLNVTSENLTSAESRIRDTNMAEEMMNFTKNQILAQASQSMLAQANQLPQGVLSLLQ